MIAIPREFGDIVRRELCAFMEVLKTRVLACLLQEDELTALCAWKLSCISDFREVIASTLWGEKPEINIALILNTDSKIPHENDGPLVIKNPKGDPVQIESWHFGALSKAIDAAVARVIRDGSLDRSKVRPVRYNGHECKSFRFVYGSFSVRFTPVLLLQTHGHPVYSTFDHTRAVSKITPRTGKRPAAIAAEHYLSRMFFPAFAYALHCGGLLRLFPRTALYSHFVDEIRATQGVRRDDRLVDRDFYDIGHLGRALTYFTNCLACFEVFCDDIHLVPAPMFSAFDRSIMVFEQLPRDNTTRSKIYDFQHSVCIAMKNEGSLVQWIIDSWQGFIQSIPPSSSN